MKRFVSMFLISALFVVVVPNRGQSQDNSSSDAQARLQTMIDAIWDASANFRAEVESRHNVTITKEQGMRTLKALYPKTMQYVEEYARQRWGLEIIEMDGGVVQIIISRRLIKPGEGGIVARFWGFARGLGAIFLFLNLQQIADNIIEDHLVGECVGMGLDAQWCQEAANAMTDDLRYRADPTVAGCALGSLCMARLLNELERVQEHRLPHPDPLNPMGGIRRPPPAGMTPQEVGRFPCPGGSNHEVQTPIRSPSPPGSNGTSGSFDGGTITVTASPLPCT